MSAKIILSRSRDIPFDKLILSQSNVRRIKVGVSIEELAEDIARRTLLQSLTVRPVRDAEGVETGLFEIPAGGRRYRALELLVKQKRLARTAPVPCVVREDGVAEEDSLAENVQRAPLHPLDQFRAFLALREKGQCEEEIAAAFFVPVAVVKQRLKLASVSPKLLDVYAEDAMTLEQLMAFTVNADHARQETVFERLCASYDKQPYAIRRMLTEGAVRASDKRAQFIGVDAYVEAGGVILRDLFENDQGGWLQDAGLLDTLVADRLNQAAADVRGEGWRWVEVAPDFPYGHTYGLRQVRGEIVPLRSDEQTTRNALQAEADGLEAAYAADEELPEDADQRIGEIETALAVIDERPISYDPDEVARGGAFVSLDGSGRLRVERGYVRSEDEAPVTADPQAGGEHGVVVEGDQRDDDGDGAESGAVDEPEEDEGLKPLPDRLKTELTSHRTLALRRALGEHPEVAFLAALHALTLRVFYRHFQNTCLELDLKTVGFSAQVSGLTDSLAATALNSRHAAWAATLPKEAANLWDALIGFDDDSRHALFAYCVSQSVNAVYETYNRRPGALAHGDRLAQAVDLDMVAAGWVATVDSFLGRVTKARILEAVREAKGERAASGIEHLKKVEMAEAAQDLLAGTGWLPEPLRTLGQTAGVGVPHNADASLVAEAATDVGAHAMAAE